MMAPPRFFDWLLRRWLPRGQAGDSIRGDLLEEPQASAYRPGARFRYRAQVLSIVVSYRPRVIPKPVSLEEISLGAGGWGCLRT